NRLPRSLEKRPARPQNNRCAQYELEPARHVALHPVRRVREQMRHRQYKHRHAQNGPDPKSASHIAKLSAFLRVAGLNVLRLQRHSADRAIARAILFDLRMHWTGVDSLSRFAGSRIARTIVCFVSRAFAVHVAIYEQCLEMELWRV